MSVQSITLVKYSVIIIIFALKSNYLSQQFFCSFNFLICLIEMKEMISVVKLLAEYDLPARPNNLSTGKRFVYTN